MKTKTPKKAKKTKYESVERVSRWNLCQQISRLMYASKKSNEDLEFEIEMLEGELLNKCN